MATNILLVTAIYYLSEPDGDDMLFAKLSKSLCHTTEQPVCQ